MILLSQDKITKSIWNIILLFRTSLRIPSTRTTPKFHMKFHWTQTQTDYLRESTNPPLTISSHNWIKSKTQQYLFQKNGQHKFHNEGLLTWRKCFRIVRFVRELLWGLFRPRAVSRAELAGHRSLVGEVIAYDSGDRVPHRQLRTVPTVPKGQKCSHKMPTGPPQQVQPLYFRTRETLTS